MKDLITVYYNHFIRAALHLVAADTPDTAFYQWVPFTLVFQVNEVMTLHNILLYTTFQRT